MTVKRLHGSPAYEDGRRGGGGALTLALSQRERVIFAAVGGGIIAIAAGRVRIGDAGVVVGWGGAGREGDAGGVAGA